MPSRVVKQPNGKLAVFSTIVDHFTVADCDEQEMRGHWIAQIGEKEGNAKVDRGLADDCTGICDKTADDGLNRWRDCIDTIRLVHGDKEADEAAREIFEEA